MSVEIRKGSETIVVDGLKHVRAGDVFRTHDTPGGEGTGPWLYAKSDAKQKNSRIRPGKTVWAVESSFLEQKGD